MKRFDCKSDGRISCNPGPLGPRKFAGSRQGKDRLLAGRPDLKPAGRILALEPRLVGLKPNLQR